MGQNVSVLKNEDIINDPVFSRFCIETIPSNDIFWKKLFSCTPNILIGFDQYALDEKLKNYFQQFFKAFNGNFLTLIAFFVKKANDYIFSNSTGANERVVCQETLFNILFMIYNGMKYLIQCDEPTFHKHIIINGVTRIGLNALFEHDPEFINALQLDDYYIFRHFIYSLLELVITSTYTNKSHNLENYLLILQAIDTLMLLLSVQMYRPGFIALNMTFLKIPSTNLQQTNISPFSSIIYEILYLDPQIKEEYAGPFLKALLWYTNDTNLRSLIKDKNLHLSQLQQSSNLEGSLIINFGTKIAGGLYNGVMNRLPLIGGGGAKNNSGDILNSSISPGKIFNPDTQTVPSYLFYPGSISQMITDCKLNDHNNGDNLNESTIVPNVKNMANGHANIETQNKSAVQLKKKSIDKTNQKDFLKDESNLVNVLSRRSELLLTVLVTCSMPPLSSDPIINNNNNNLNNNNNDNKSNNNKIMSSAKRENYYLELLRTFNNDTGDAKYDSSYTSTHQTSSPSNANDASSRPHSFANGRHLYTAFTINFNALYQYFSSRLAKRPTTTLLFYLTFHQNSHFKAYVLARSDIELLLLPLLENTYETSINLARYSPCHHLYMSLIICLIFTEDDLFNTSIHKIHIKSPPWFTEHVITGQISLGSFMILVLLRVVQNNLYRIRDKYLHTNCLAALSNMSTKFYDIHSYTAQRILSVYSILLKHYLKMVKKVDDLHKNSDINLDVNVKQAELQLALSDAQTLREMLAMFLECFHNVLSSQSSLLQTNVHLIYTMLYNDKLLRPQALTENNDVLGSLNETPYYPTNLINLLSEIHNVMLVISQRLQQSSSPSSTIDSITNGLTSSSSGISAALEANSTSYLTANEAMNHLKQILKILPDRTFNSNTAMKFKYVEEEWPEIFFVPYTWSLVCAYIHLYFDLTAIKLFRPADYYYLEDLSINT